MLKIAQLVPCTQWWCCVAVWDNSELVHSSKSLRTTDLEVFIPNTALQSLQEADVIQNEERKCTQDFCTTGKIPKATVTNRSDKQS